ncbi:GH18152 [Drosophila grimshawi]|uniref:GH18152 n=2 Tax=Drosophila grimshawi TaxID=7222 RepID=B4JGH3_DROGR|nr:GH18152 [Drosophila grimshawi]
MPPTDCEYDVMYMPKRDNNKSGHPTISSELKSNSRSRNHTKLCYNDLISLKGLQDHNENRQLSHSLKSQSGTPARTVEFRLSPVEQQHHRMNTMQLRENGGLATVRSDHRQKQNQQQKHKQQKVCPPSNMASSAFDSNRETQETFADFFNLIYENVEHMVKKHYEEILSKIEQLSTNLMQQQSLIKQNNSEIMDKIAEQKEASINQFKFTAQMLIDTQTIYYKALTHERPLKHQHDWDSEEVEEQKKTTNSERMQRSTQNCNQESESPQQSESQTQKNIQHHLCQQQDHYTKHQQQPICKNCKTHKSLPRPERSTPRQKIIRRSRKGVSSVSMPDLHNFSILSTSSTSYSNEEKLRSHTPTVGSHRRCRCQCPSAASTQGQLNYIVSLRRKTCSLSKAMPSLEDVVRL